VAAVRLAGVTPRGGAVTLGAAGVVHGAFGTGGPLVVMALAGLGLDKRVFRGTLSALWALLAVGLLASYALAGALTRESFVTSLMLAPALAVGLLLGQRVHARLDPARFRAAVDVLLLLAGVVMLARTLGGS
ncbi:MAG: TSUP family transporter, partial [Myxococcota bacterium]